jgi:hypothetical protein
VVTFSLAETADPRENPPATCMAMLTLHGMGGERPQHGDAAAAARQEHDAGCRRCLVERLGKLVAVEFGRNVKIMDMRRDARLHQRLGSAHERSGGIQQRADVVKRDLCSSAIVHCEQAIFDAELSREGRELCLVLLATSD